MKVKDTAEGWEIIPETSDEQARLKWLIEGIQGHPDQRACETLGGVAPREGEHLPSV